MSQLKIVPANELSSHFSPLSFVFPSSLMFPRGSGGRMGLEDVVGCSRLQSRRRELKIVMSTSTQNDAYHQYITLFLGLPLATEIYERQWQSEGWRLAAGQEPDDAMMERREHEVSPHLVLTKILVSISKIEYLP